MMVSHGKGDTYRADLCLGQGFSSPDALPVPLHTTALPTALHTAWLTFHVQLFPHRLGDPLTIGIALPGIALQVIQPFVQVLDRPLVGAVQPSQFFAGDGY